MIQIKTKCDITDDLKNKPTHTFTQTHKITISKIPRGQFVNDDGHVGAGQGDHGADHHHHWLHQGVHQLRGVHVHHVVNLRRSFLYIILIIIIVIIVIISAYKSMAPCAQCTPCKESVLATFLITLWD